MKKLDDLELEELSLIELDTKQEKETDEKYLWVIIGAGLATIAVAGAVIGAVVGVTVTAFAAMVGLIGWIALKWLINKL